MALYVLCKPSLSTVSTTTLAASTSVFDSPMRPGGRTSAFPEPGPLPYPEDEQDSEAVKIRVMELYQQMGTPMLAYLRSLGLFDSDAGDVIQETFLRLMNHLAAGRPEGNLRAWLFQVAYSQAMDVHRFDIRFSSLSEDNDEARIGPREVPDRSPTPEQALIENEKLQRVRIALQYLPAQQRECVMLRSQGLRYREIASSLGVSTQRVATLMGRGISRLVAIL